MATQNPFELFVGMLADAVVERISARAGHAGTPAAAKAAPASGKRRLSAAARAKMRAAAKLRWARVRASQPTPAAAPKDKPAKKGRRGLSAEAKAKIGAAAKARWARFRAAKKKK